MGAADSAWFAGTQRVDVLVLLGDLQVVERVHQVDGRAPELGQRAQVAVVDRLEIVDQDGRGEVTDVVDLGRDPDVPSNPDRVARARDRRDAFGKIFPESSIIRVHNSA